MSQVICYDNYGRKVNYLTQWDMNVFLLIRDWEYDIKPVFHFANLTTYSSEPFNVAGDNVALITETDGSKTVKVDVPNALLQVAEPIKIFIFLVDNKNVGETIYEININVHKKAKPSDYEFEENIKPVSLESLEQKMSEIVADAENLVQLQIDALDQEYESLFSNAVTTLQNSFQDGTPKAPFTNVSDLENADAGIYILDDDTNDYYGYVYYWDGENISSPIIKYNAQGIGEGQVTYKMLSNDVRAKINNRDVKTALLNLLEHVAFTDENGQTYYQALYNALYPSANLVSITALFEQGNNVIYDTSSLNDLMQYLTVIAYYDDNTNVVVTDYTLSGTLTEGTSIITVLYGAETVTFNVTVTESGSDMNGWKDGVAYDNLTVVNDSYVKAADGTFNSYNGWSRTGYVPCNGVDTLDFSVGYDTGQNDRLSNAFYDSEKRYIQNFTVPRGVGTINVPANAHYFALSCTTSLLNSCISGGITPNAQVVTE